MEEVQKLKWLFKGAILFYSINWAVAYGIFRYAESGNVTWFLLKEPAQRIIPLIIFLFEPWNRHQILEKYRKLIKYSLLISAVVGVLALNNPISQFWKHSAIIEWGVVGFSLLWLYDYKIGNLFFALYLTVQSVSMGSIYYELPLLPHMTNYQIIGLRSPYVIATSFLALPLLIHGLSFLKFQIKKPIIITAVFYVVFSVAWTLSSNPFKAFPYWFMRLPMMFVLLAIPLSLKKEKQ